MSKIVDVDMDLAGHVLAGVGDGVASTDAVNKGQLDGAAATAAGTVLVDGADTTAGHLATKIDVAGFVTKSVESGGGNEKLLLTVPPPWL